MPDEATYPRSPFTVAQIREILRSVLKANQKMPPPDRLEHLTMMLNMIHDLYRFAVTTGNESEPRGERVRAAVGVLHAFFKERERECFPEVGPAPDPVTLKSEIKLLRLFSDFLEGMKSHIFNLSMDAGVMMPHLESWHDIAFVLSGDFRMGKCLGYPTMVPFRASSRPSFRISPVRPRP
jgi:hypothetical protein